MFTNLVFGTLLVSTSVLIQTIGLMLLSGSMPRITIWFRLQQHDFGKTVAIVATVLGLFLIHTVEIWCWAILFFVIGATRDFEGALYLSTTTFSTVGNNDVIINPVWRLLTSFEGVDGFILIGWSIAYLVAASTRYGPFRSGEHF